MTHSVKTETHTTLVEQTEPSSSNEKIDHPRTTEVVARVGQPMEATPTEHFSTLIVVPAEASHQSVTPHSGEAGSRTDGPTPPRTISGSFGPELPSNVIQQTVMAEDRRALPRQNRESKK
ncbi:hypothetical protein AAVH_01860 [Aphelenchoides avenae]|nr:hypothetical protein AAVH_01860 [Aphelenchus avenae]